MSKPPGWHPEDLGLQTQPNPVLDVQWDYKSVQTRDDEYL